MATNAKKSDKDKPVTDEDLADAKYGKEGVEAKADEPTEPTDETAVKEETEEQEEDKPEPAEEETPTFTKQITSIPGDTPEEYHANLEQAYNESTSEALRLVQKVRELETPKEEPAEAEELNADQLFLRQLQQQQIEEAFAPIKEKYPQANDPTEYAKFVTKANRLGRLIYETENRIASPTELYADTIAALGWKTDDDKEKLGNAVKTTAASSKTTSATKPKGESKVDDNQISLYRKMHGGALGKSDSEIRKELEDYIT